MLISEKFATFNNNLAIKWESSVGNQEIFNYKEVIDAKEIVQRALQDVSTKKCEQNIGVLLCHSAVIVPVILGILESNAAFCCLNPNQSGKEIEDLARLLQCSIAIATTSFSSGKSEYPILKEFELFNQRMVIIRLVAEDFIDRHKLTTANGIENIHVLQSSKTMFCCSTSGTTGSPKMVRVPFKCVMPNVASLSKLYAITQSDVIYISSPPTFDPFVVDVCLALFNGATILMVSNEIRLSAHLLLTTLLLNSATIMQITPSLFRQWSDKDIRIKLLSSSSSLRCLIFGGEPFPTTEEVSSWFCFKGEITTRVRLFNIYGITEVSCWSTIYEVPLIDIQYKSLVPIGMPLDQYTQLRVIDCLSKEIIHNGVGELFIESNIRKCAVGAVDFRTTDDFVSVATGDLVEINSGTIYYKTRLNNIVKIYGRKINLTKIENATRTLDSSIKNVCCVFHKDDNSLNLFVQCEDRSEKRRKDILRNLRTKLVEQEVPNEIFLVDEFPLSCHGKVSKKKLLESMKQTGDCSVNEYLLKKFEENLPRYSRETIKDMSFLSAGGSSILALQIINELERKCYINDTHLITMLLNIDTSIEQVLSHLKDLEPVLVNSTCNSTLSSISCLWSHDMIKCIDASPTFCEINQQNILSVGSHSHLLINVDADSGEIMSKIIFPDRIESQVVQYNSSGIVGCYDGFIYCFDICSGVEKWKFDSGGMVKCKMQIVNDWVMFGNYNSEANLWCLSAENGIFIWNRKIGNKSIYADVQVLNANAIVVATLDGVLVSLEVLTGNTLWQIQFQSPIFSTPNVLDNKVIVAEVLGIVHCVDCNGNVLCSYRANGNIYSSIESNGAKIIYFGCYDRHIYCLSIEANSSLCQLMWRAETPGQIFSTPRFFKHDSVNFLLVCTSNGFMCVINESGKVFRQFKIDGEIFSSPSVKDGRIVVGSRNNFLYCFDVNKMLIPP